MKKFILAVLMCLCLSSVVFAQKGSFTIGGRIGFGTNCSKESMSDEIAVTDKGLSWTISPDLQYFVSNTVSVGTSFTIGGSSELTDAAAGANNVAIYDRTSSWAVAPYVAYYLKLVDKFYYSPSLHVSYGGTTYMKESVISGTIATTEQPVSTFGVGINAISFGYIASEKVALGISIDSGLGYSSEFSTNTVGNSEIKLSNRSFNFNANTLGAIIASVVYCF